MAKSNVGKKPIISEEEYTTNKVLTVFSVCLLGVLVLMILQRLLNYGSTWATGMVVTKVLLGVGVLGVIWSLFLFAQEKSGKRSGKNRIVCGRNALLVSLVMIVIMAAILYIGPAPVKALYVLLPVLAVYYLVYHSYQREFFVIAADCGAAVALMWLGHRAQDDAFHLGRLCGTGRHGRDRGRADHRILQAARGEGQGKARRQGG